MWATIVMLLPSQAQYVGSALSFYFVYDFCLGPTISSIDVYLIRYLPLGITITVAVAIVAFR